MRPLLQLSSIITLAILLIPNLILANTYRELDYTISPSLNSKTPFIKINLEIKGDLSGKLPINLPYKWADGDYVEQIKNVNVSNPDYKFKIDKKNRHRLTINIPKKTDSIKISYEIHQKPNNTSNVHESIIRSDLIHSPGYGLFVTLGDMEPTTKVPVNIEWKGLPPEWKTLSSYGTGRILRFEATDSKLMHAIYLAGNVRLYQTIDNPTPVFLSLYGKFHIKDSKMIASLRQIISSQRAFFNDHDFPFYAVSIIKGSDEERRGGTGLYNMFTAWYPENIAYTDYYISIARGHLYNSRRGKILNTKQEELNYWWSEGFIDYHARVLGLRSGGLSLDKFITECNEFLRDYYLSPVINEPSTRIQKNFWNDYDVQGLPYYRGFVFAIYLNNLIKSNNPDKSLDNITLDLLKDAKEKEFSGGYFKTIAKNYIPQGIEAEMYNYIDQGKTIDLGEVSKSLPLEKIAMGGYERGFDRDALIKDKIIKNINEKSNAYKAGLREGDKIISYDFPKGGGDPDQTVTIKTKDKTFRYRPESSDKRVIYQLKTNLSAEDKLRIKKFFGVEFIFGIANLG